MSVKAHVPPPVQLVSSLPPVGLFQHVAWAELNACLKDFRYGANLEFGLSAMGQTAIFAMGQTRKSPEYVTIMAVMRAKADCILFRSSKCPIAGAKC